MLFSQLDHVLQVTIQKEICFLNSCTIQSMLLNFKFPLMVTCDYCPVSWKIGIWALTGWMQLNISSFSPCLRHLLTSAASWAVFDLNCFILKSLSITPWPKVSSANLFLRLLPPEKDTAFTFMYINNILQNYQPESYWVWHFPLGWLGWFFPLFQDFRSFHEASSILEPLLELWWF